MLTMKPNKLECLYLEITFQSSLTFAGNTRSLPKKEPSEKSSNWVCLLGLVVSNEWKKFYNNVTWCQYLKKSSLMILYNELECYLP